MDRCLGIPPIPNQVPNQAFAGDFDNDGCAELMLCMDEEKLGYIFKIAEHTLGDAVQWEFDSTIPWAPLQPNESAVVVHVVGGDRLFTARSDGNNGTLCELAGHKLYLPTFYNRALVGHFHPVFEQVALFQYAWGEGERVPRATSIIDFDGQELKLTEQFELWPQVHKYYRFGLTGDFDGDGLDEIALRLLRQDVERDYFCVADYDPVTRGWYELDGNALDCHDLPGGAGLAISGNFVHETFPAIAVFPASPAGHCAFVMTRQGVPRPFAYHGSLPLSEKVSEKQLLDRAFAIATFAAFTPKNNLQYISEAFYSVPIFLAQKLQQAGVYEAALDWLHTVYNYRAPAEMRWVYPLLDQPELPRYMRDADWLLGSSNPHAIALARPGTYLRYTFILLAQCLTDYADAEFTHDTSEALARAQTLYTRALEQLDLPVLANYEDEVGVLEAKIGELHQAYFSVAPNLLLKSLRRHIELNLHKLHAGRNIAGMQRQVEIYSESVSLDGKGLLSETNSRPPNSNSPKERQPTPYRFKVLLDRAKQLAQYASQMESSMLSMLEKKDAEAYSLLKARQDVDLTQAQAQLQNLRVNEAQESYSLAELQKDKAKKQFDHYDKLLADGLLASETKQIGILYAIAALQSFVSEVSVSVAKRDMIEGFISGWSLSNGGISVSLRTWSELEDWKKLNVAASMGAAANLASTQATLESLTAGYLRRQQEWEFQKDLANWDITLGDQQIKLASSHKDVILQEQAISKVQAQHAQAIVNFLSTKFTNVELYDWMSRVLEDVYWFFLQQATATARLAANQLAFERPDAVPPVIGTDYWVAPTASTSVDQNASSAPDRHGLTGSARLLQDIYRLDQYAFETDKRKLQITRTISLASLVPYEFQGFRQSGVLAFRTPMGLFDYDFPGHYLRLIKRVRTSVIALIPPIEGIKATLTSNGISRVVTGGDRFQTIVVRRDPESVALSAPINASGLFELETQSEMLFPFEGSGVDTSWEFSMPKAANGAVDYRTIADVLLTIEYTALSSADYRQEVIQRLGNIARAERAFSLRTDFPDGWYLLNNPGQNSKPLAVTLETSKEDFPPFAEGPIIQNVLLYFVPKREQALALLPPIKLTLTPADAGARTVGGEATPGENGVCSILRGGCGNWLPMIGYTVAGVWDLTIPNTQEVRNLFNNGSILDIVLVISYAGRLPDWPA